MSGISTMWLARAVLVPCLTMLAATFVLPATACQRRAESERPAASEHGSGAAIAGNQASAAPGRSMRAPGTLEERFAEEIARNLPQVPDPKVVVSREARAELGNEAFRDRAIAFVRQVSAGGESVTCELSLASRWPFRVAVSIFERGEQRGGGEASDAELCIALKDATRRAIAAAGGAPAVIDTARFAVELPDHHYAFTELEGKGVELARGLVPVRRVDKALIHALIAEGKAYLLRTIHARRKGVHKYYHATTDRFEDELHTIYTASTVLTLLKLHARERDEKLRETITGAADFILSMQSRDRRERSYGGFYYSFDLRREQPGPKLVVGTTSKVIFTLLELHALTKDARYLDAALLGASWLISMQRPDGSVRSYLRRKDSGEWVFSKKESLLYTGQVLSALSRVYGATGKVRYRDAARRTASYLTGKVMTRGCYLGDDYREPNPISSSWVIYSLLDFVKATGDSRARDIVFRCAGELLERQIDRPGAIHRHGRWPRSLSSSGHGWLAEVMAELYVYCREQRMGGCERFEDAIIKVIRVLAQHTYTPESAFVARNPEAAIGGVFWSVTQRYVRTDSVCHAMNAYLAVIDHLGDGPLIEIPELPLARRLALAGAAMPVLEETVDEDVTAADDPDDLPMSRVDESAEQAADEVP